MLIIPCILGKDAGKVWILTHLPTANVKKRRDRHIPGLNRVNLLINSPLLLNLLC